ncbi:MAG TPA: hypothetical protein VM937_11990, partial [Burkholderiaceae bacterium]|nr:hypothetical protein [Burkholderiaceae bacterium]
MSRLQLVAVLKRALQGVFVLVVAGCATVDPYALPPMVQNLQRDDAVGYCARLFADIDRRIESLHVRDAEAHRIAGFPYLRVDRVSAALAARAIGSEQTQAWRARLRELDESARATELANATLSIDDLPRCRSLLESADTDAAAIASLRAAAKVPDDYSIGLRVLGVYPLARLPFAAGIARWQADTRAAFTTPLDALPVRGQLLRYGPAQSLELPPTTLSVDVLGVPIISAAQAAALFARHAPVLHIDAAGEFDRIGGLKLDAEDQVFVDAAAVVVYTRLTYALIGGLIHPQLVYTFWFGERPRAAGGTFDLLAGKLDGVVWRVTINAAGDALVYDSMHACGCYHLFFPTEKVVTRSLPATLDETLFVPQTVRGVGRGEKVVLGIESGTHYLQRVLVGTISEDGQPPAIAYALQDERKLTTMPRRAGGTRSAYGEDGMIAGTERAERWFFWPMGIKSAGQMRQWGHHATAFVGRRHFDDPLLFDAYFDL